MANIWNGFIGSWTLDLTRSYFEQNEPPLSASYRIEETSEGLVMFIMGWVDTEGEQHTVTFAGNPDGEIRPFAGGELADSMSVSAPSEFELNTSAFFQGREVMSATRLQVSNGNEMLLTQTVYFPDNTSVKNTSLYLRDHLQAQ